MFQYNYAIKMTEEKFNAEQTASLRELKINKLLD